jgi:hypothetical protein
MQAWCKIITAATQLVVELSELQIFKREPLITACGSVIRHL